MKTHKWSINKKSNKENCSFLFCKASDGFKIGSFRLLFPLGKNTQLSKIIN
jgi:hypothetical protein